MDLVPNHRLRGALHFLVSLTNVNGTGVEESDLNTYVTHHSPFLRRQMVRRGSTRIAGTPRYVARSHNVGRILIELNWASDDGEGLFLPTRLGRDVHEAIRREELQHGQEEVREIFLGREDPLAYATLVGHLAGIGPYMLVDPYFRFDQLSPLIPPKTELNKVLVSNRIKPEDKSALLQAIEDIQDGITIRIAKEGALHDRLAIGNSTVLQIGTSFNAVGKTSTTLINLDNTAEDMRREYENHWQEATDLTGDEL